MWWEPMLANSTPLKQPGYQSYAVLTICRGLYTLEHGKLAPKAVAAYWARKRLPAHLQGVVDNALGGASLDNALATQALIRHALDAAQ
jgi:hypothetical protein